MPEKINRSSLSIQVGGERIGVCSVWSNNYSAEKKIPAIKSSELDVYLSQRYRSDSLFVDWVELVGGGVFLFKPTKDRLRQGRACHSLFDCLFRSQR